ncbi:MAG: hypothetical protein KC543_11000 [Myxococcales bacterium]|nr:hypothetical protein [Myxococcales bacterium]
MAVLVVRFVLVVLVVAVLVVLVVRFARFVCWSAGRRRLTSAPEGAGYEQGAEADGEPGKPCVQPERGAPARWTGHTSSLCQAHLDLSA